MRAEAALLAAPEIVGEAQRGDRRDRRTIRHPDLPADQRQPEAAEVDAERAAGIDGVAELPRPVEEAAGIAPGGAVTERQLDLAELEPGARGVDRHPHLAAEAGRDGEAGGPGRGRERPLARERLSRRDAAEHLDQVARDPLRDPESTADTFRERGHGQVATAVDEPCEVAVEIRVAEQQPARRRRSLGGRQRLSLAAARQTERDRTGPLGGVRRVIAGAVVGDDHLRFGKRLAQRRDGSPDHRLLVARGDKDRERLIHSTSQRAASPAAEDRAS